MQFKTIFIFLFIKLLFSLNIKAQKLDSLLYKLNNYKREDTIKLNLLNAIARKYQYVNPDKGLETSNTAISLAKKLNRQDGLALAYLAKGENYLAQRQLPSATESFQKSLSIAENVNNKDIIAICYSEFGRVNAASSNYPKALEYFQKALNINRQLSNEQKLAINLGNIGSVYLNVSEYQKALEYLQKALDINEKKGDKENMASNISNMGLGYLRLGDNPKALECFQKALAIDEDIGNKSRAANDLNFMGILYGTLSDNQKSQECFQKALIISEEVGDKSGIAQALGNLAIFYKRMSDYPKALEYQQRALRINEVLKRKQGIAATFANIGDIYDYLGDHDKALQYYQKALDLQKEIGDKHYVASHLNNIGSVYYERAEYVKAIQYFKQVLELERELGIENAGVLNNIGIAYNGLSEYGEAFEYFKKSLTLSEISGEKDIIAMNLLGIGIVYANISDTSLSKIGVDAESRFIKAQDYLNRSLDTARKYELLGGQSSALESLSMIYEKQKNYPKSIEAYKNFITIRDSMVNDKKKKEITRLEIQYEFDKKEDSLKLQQALTGEKLKQQVLLAKQQQQQLELNQKELALSNKEKDLQKLAYLKTQADLQNEQLEKQKGDKQLTIVQKEKALQQSQVKNLSQQQALSKLRLQEQWLYSISILILLGAIASFFIYRNRIKHDRLKIELAKEKEEQEKKEAEFQRNLADVSLTALRSQMNPHFIFNCLNSIKLYTTQNDTIAASEYLTKFSKLIRLVMENSRNDRISLASELNALRLYIEMEAMRFKEKLQYNIKVDKDVETDFIEIPPLLLQPYVENAIWHGLMHKEEGGKIDINAAMRKEESLLEINITDNGIGRAKAAELRSKTATRHKSYGMKVTSERIALINQIYKTGANVSIHDLMNDEGRPAGTLVTIQIPV